MAVLLLLQTGHQMVPDVLHRACGIALFLLAVGHLVVTRRRTAALARGGWGFGRVLTLVVDVACLALVAAMALSGLSSAGLLRGLPQGLGRPSLYRDIHMVAVYLSLVVFSLHLGMHRRQVAGRLRAVFSMLSAAERARRHAGGSGDAGRARGSGRAYDSRRARVMRWAALLLAVVCAVGAYQTYDLQLAAYISHAARFARIEEDATLLPYLARFASVMVLFATVGALAARALSPCGARKAAASRGEQ